jgi:pyruvyltransferase
LRTKNFMRRTGLRLATEGRYWLARAFDARRDGLGRRLPCYWYAWETNFGDALTAPLLEGLFGLRPVLVHRQHHGKVLAVGSVMAAALPGDAVWGSGAIEDRRIDGRGVRFLAVRGPLTRALIDGDVPEVYGDPAILLPDLHRPRPAPRYDVGIIPHYSDEDIMTTNDPAVATISMATAEWRGVIDRIAACDVVVSSSLHGIIVAEAYGVPAVWVQPTDRIKGGRFKFDDYYQSTGRDAVMRTWNDGLAALTRQDWRPPTIDRKALVDAWPIHWRSRKSR